MQAKIRSDIYDQMNVLCEILNKSNLSGEFKIVQCKPCLPGKEYEIKFMRCIKWSYVCPDYFIDCVDFDCADINDHLFSVMYQTMSTIKSILINEWKGWRVTINDATDRSIWFWIITPKGIDPDKLISKDKITGKLFNNKYNYITGVMS